ncbi:SipW-dependent-type signal peptide-containing protein [Halobacterium litoreum]|uniref:SipW-dependent-type signal peptide-containing protein n=1 Tax=Halobacterium litoreum TaxID=2039234 RepID=A0ABD5NCN4_9EURY|nr:SipW-dependent-type signal peptide-containing protein [Halobacterium litoreum]UHH14243.1 CalY family protein [Halobacterium litoreum]
MTDDTPRLTRRRLLAGLGGIGAGAALGGTGTMAFLNDTESSEGNAVTAGELDLKIDWTEHYNGEKVERQALTDAPGPVFDLGDVKPGDWGEATISLHVFENPSYVHMAGDLTANHDNGLTEPEGEVDDTGGAREGDLADEILVDVWYDGTDEEEDGGNNELEPGEVIISSGTLQEVLDKLSTGVLLDNQVGDGVPVEPTAGASQTESVTAEYVGEATGGPQEEQCIEFVPCDDPDVLATPTGLSGFCYEPDPLPPGTTHVTLKAANGCYLAEVSASTDEICLPDEQPEGVPNNQYGDISNATFYRCPDGDNGNGGNGDDGDGECWPNSTTQYIGFSWRLPETVGNEVQGDSVAFDLEFYAQQCRHNDDPANPYAPE